MNMCALVLLAVWVWRLITGFSTFQYHQPDSLDLIWDKTQNIFWSWRLTVTVTQARNCQDDQMNFCLEESSIFYWQGLVVWRSDPVVDTQLIIGRADQTNIRNIISTEKGEREATKTTFWCNNFHCMIKLSVKVLVVFSQRNHFK